MARNKAVEAALKRIPFAEFHIGPVADLQAARQRWREGTEDAIEAAAPHIIEQFIDEKLTDIFLADLIVDEIYNSQAGLGRDFKAIRDELKGLIPK